MDLSNIKKNLSSKGSPLCLFYFSPSFAIVTPDPGSRSELETHEETHATVKSVVKAEFVSKSRKHRNSRTANGNLSAVRRRRFTKKKSTWTLVKYLTESVGFHSRRNKLPCLEDVLNTLQAAWLQDNGFVKCSSTGEEDFENTPMAHSHDMCKEKQSSGFPSPVLMRRRLSAPETIMRKHTLSQQRSDSTESDSTQLSSVSHLRLNNNNSFWNRTSTTGSESNLSSRKQYKRDPDLMRKSTLLRRMWSREFTGSISRLYNEEIFPKKSLIKSQSRSPVRSIRSSPEHLSKDRVNGRFSPERTRINGDVGLIKTKWDPAPDMNSYSSYTSDVISRLSSTSESNKSILETSSTDIKVSSICTTTSTENDSFSSTKTTTETSGFHIDDNSDSAYTNTQTYSTFSSSKSNSENNNNEGNVDFSEIESKQTLEANYEKQGQSDNYSFNTHAPSDLNSNCSTQYVDSKSSDHKCSNSQSDVNEAAPKIDEQSSDLNIVNVSAATLNIIINTTPDASTVRENISRVSDHASVTIQEQKPAKKTESFYLKQQNDMHISAEHSRLIKYMISNVGTGSLYSKPTEAPQLVVPRYSALPRSVSMEVNTSSADSTDKESDTASLVDSLDDPNSPRQSALTPRIKYDDKPVRGDLSTLLPDNSSNKDTPRIKSQKGSAFYVSIVQDELPENIKTVAEHLPERVRNRLSKRQQIMEQKKLSAKSKTDNQNVDPNGNQTDRNAKETGIISESCTTNGTLKKMKREKKLKNPLQTLPSYKVNSRGELTLNPNATMKLKRSVKQNKRKHTKYSGSSESSTNTVTLRHSVWNHHAQMESPTVPPHKKEFVSEPAIRQIVETPSFNNRIEILEIMECVEPAIDKSLSNQVKNNIRSKIPVPVQYKVQDVTHKQMQTVYQAYDVSKPPEDSPKTDQLIANILIDALNKPDVIELKAPEKSKTSQNQPNEKRPVPMILGKIPANRYYQKFEMIPEEKLSSLGSSAEDAIIAIVEDKPLLETEREVAISTEVQTDTENKYSESSMQSDRKCVADASSQTDIPLETSPELPHRIPDSYKGKAALAMIKDEDFSTIPKGWITFYMLRKSPGSPESSTDEGTNMEGKNNNIEDKNDGLEIRQLRPVLIKRRIGNKENLSDFLPEDNAENNNTKINNNTVRDDDLKRSFSLEHTKETLVISKKDHYSSSTESSKSNSPSNEHDVDLKSTCPLPVALSSRQGRRQSYRKGRYKTSQNQNTNSSQMPGGWSVTVSGTNTCGQPAPDLEMRLKFPCPQPQSQSDSGLGEEHPRPPRRHFEQQPNDNEFHLPPAKPVQTKKYTVITRNHNTDDLADDTVNTRSFQYLPDLIKNKGQKTAKRRDCSVPVTRYRGQQLHPRQSSGLDLLTTMPPLKMRGVPLSGLQKPRQTLTSYRRFSLHHSSHISPHFRTLLPSALSNESLNTADLIDLPECFPAILAVTGSAISPENKPRVPTMSEKDLTRNHFSFGQHHA